MKEVRIMKNMAMMGFVAGAVLGIALGMQVDDAAVDKCMKRGRCTAKKTMRRIRSMM